MSEGVVFGRSSVSVLPDISIKKVLCLVPSVEGYGRNHGRDRGRIFGVREILLLLVIREDTRSIMDEHKRELWKMFPVTKWQAPQYYRPKKTKEQNTEQQRRREKWGDRYRKWVWAKYFVMNPNGTEMFEYILNMYPALFFRLGVDCTNSKSWRLVCAIHWWSSTTLQRICSSLHLQHLMQSRSVEEHD